MATLPDHEPARQRPAIAELIAGAAMLYAILLIGYQSFLWLQNGVWIPLPASYLLAAPRLPTEQEINDYPVDQVPMLVILDKGVRDKKLRLLRAKRGLLAITLHSTLLSSASSAEELATALAVTRSEVPPDLRWGHPATEPPAEASEAPTTDPDSWIGLTKVVRGTIAFINFFSIPVVVLMGALVVAIRFQDS